jgi:hypothetical protein
MQGYPTGLLHLGSQVMTDGAPNVLPSPCGVNCSYELAFEGPYVQCTNASSYTYLNMTDFSFQIYTGTFGALSNTSCYRNVYRKSGIMYFNTTTLIPLEFDTYTLSLLVEVNNLSCVPFRANYSITNTYENNIQKTKVTTIPIEPLVNFNQNCTLQGPETIEVPGFSSGGNGWVGTNPANWSGDALAWYRDLQIMALFDAMAIPLSGNYIAPPAIFDFNSTSPIKTNLSWVDMLFIESRFPLRGGVSAIHRSIYLENTNEYHRPY